MGMPWELGMNTCGPPDEGRLRILKDVGFKYVYLNGTDLEKEALAQSHAAVRKYSEALIPWSIHLPIVFSGWEMDEASVRERLSCLLENAAPYGAPNATVHVPCYARMCGGTVDTDRAKPHREKVMRILREAADSAHARGIRLNIENDAHGVSGGPSGYDVSSAADLKEFLRILGVESVGVCLDTGHAMLAGQDPALMIRELGDILQETHFNDNFGVFPGCEPLKCDYHRPPGVGRIDWLAVMDVLEEINYPHPIVFEEGMVQVGGDTFEVLARTTYDNWRAFERARAKRDGKDPAAMGLPNPSR